MCWSDNPLAQHPKVMSGLLPGCMYLFRCGDYGLPGRLSHTVCAAVWVSRCGLGYEKNVLIIVRVM